MGYRKIKWCEKIIMEETMKKCMFFLTVLCAAMICPPVMAGTLTLSIEPEPDFYYPDSPEKNEFRINGDIYIDYSVWGNNNVIDAGDNIFVFSAGSQLIITGPGMTWDLTGIDLNLFEISEQPLAMNATGNYLFHSHDSIISTDFIASGKLIVGDFSDIIPVPVPSAMMLLLSGLFLIHAARPAGRVRPVTA